MIYNIYYIYMYTKLFYFGKHGLLITGPPGKSPFLYSYPSAWPDTSAFFPELVQTPESQEGLAGERPWGGIPLVPVTGRELRE